MKEVFKENLKKVPNFKSNEEEIKFLRLQLEQHINKETNQDSIEKKKENIAEKIVDGYRETPIENILHEDNILTEDEMEGISLNLSPEEHDSIIEDLYAFMLDNGIKNTLETVKRMNNPHIEDDFHRFLVQYLLSNHEIPGLASKKNLKKSLGLRMFEIVLPNTKVDEYDFKKIATLMEQFMAGMQSVADDRENKSDNYYTLEISKEAGNNDMSLFVAVPSRRADLFEKQILSLFEDVRITEVYDDYNIFSYSGVSSASYGVPIKYDVLQMKTYDDFENDPMKVVINTFSKLDIEKEGAAIQFIVKPSGEIHIKEYGDILDRLKKGKKLAEAVGDISIVKDISKGFKDLIFEPKKEDKENEKKIDDDAISSITDKLKSTIVHTNIRIVTSANTKQKSDDILHDLESAFHQFNNTSGNGISFERVLGGRLDNLIDDFIFRIYDEQHIFRLNLKELATLYHFPLSISSTSQLKQESSKIAPAPPETPKDGIILGVNKYRHREIYVHMAKEDRLRHFYVIGQTGTGKTHIMKSMIIQDIKNGDGVCFIDPHGSDVQDILNYIPPERIDDVVYFDPAYTERPMALNMLDYDTRYPEQKSFVINELMSIFNKLFDMKAGGGAMFEQYFRNSAGLVMEHPESGNTLLEIGRVLADKKFRDMKLRYCNNPIIKQFWANAEKTTGDQGLDNFVPYITSKFDVFISNEIMRPVVAQQKSSFNFREIMDKKKILLVNLSKGRLGEINANLIGLVLVGKILMAALSRVDSLGDKLPPFYLYIDEFQNISTDSISQILSEARKYGLGLHIAHQFIAQLDENIKNAVFGNVGSMATFRISFEDAQYIEKRFAPTFTQEDIMKIPNRSAYLQMIGHGKPLTPFNISTLPLDFFAKPNPEGIAEKIKELSYHKYGKPREEVEADIIRRFS